MSAVPPPPPQLDPVSDVGLARESVAEAEARLETTIGRAASFTEEERQQRVNGEWSTVESFRHLVLVIDLWLSRAILGEKDPFHPMAKPPDFAPPKLFPDSSIDPDATPSFDEACEVLRERIATLRRYVDALTAEELARPIKAHVGTVGGALATIFHQLDVHDSYINRDLDQLRVVEGAESP